MPPFPLGRAAGYGAGLSIQAFLPARTFWASAKKCRLTLPTAILPIQEVWLCSWILTKKLNTLFTYFLKEYSLREFIRELTEKESMKNKRSDCPGKRKYLT